MVKLEEEIRNVLPEIMEVIEDRKGFSLLIKGAPWHGKTSLALEIAEREDSSLLYVYVF